MSTTGSGLSIADWVAMSSLVVTAFAVSIAAFEFRRKEKWNQKESLANFIDILFNKPHNRSAFTLLDYDGGWVDLFPEYDQDKFDFGDHKISRFSKVTYDEVKSSLTIDREEIQKLTPKEFRIREIIDYLLTELEKLNLFIKNGLYPEKEVISLLKYHLDTISGNGIFEKNSLHIQQLKRYIICFQWNEARDFVERIHPNSFVGIEAHCPESSS